VPDRGDPRVLVYSTDGKVQYALEGAKDPAFSWDGRWLAATKTIPANELLVSDRDKDKAPKTGMLLLNTTSGEELEFENVKSWLKPQDIAILGELYWNARRKNSDMITRLKTRGWEISIPTFSRRLKMVKEECVETYRTYIYPKNFDILNTFLIWGYGNEEELQKIKTLMEIHPIPFLSTLKIDGYKLYWYLHLSTSQMSDLLYYLRPKLPELHLNYIDSPRTQTYLLNADAWDEKKQEWIVDEDFYINQVLKTLT